MYALKCDCGATIPVHLRQAGNEVTCPACSTVQKVPKLGELRTLPRIDEASPETPESSSIGMGKRITFAAFSLLAGVGVLFGAFALIMAATIEVELTTEQHIARDLEHMQHMPPAQVTQMWGEYMKYGLSERHPFPYQQNANEKAAWTRRGLVSLAIAAVAVVAAIVTVRTGRHSQHAAAAEAS